MTNEEIKIECKLMHEQIKKSEERLKQIILICKHENTFEGNWAWRIGFSEPAVICSDCGNVKINSINIW